MPHAQWADIGTSLAKYDLEGAAEAFARAASIAPEQPRYHFNLGVVLHQLGRLDEAISAYERAWALAPEFKQLATGYAYALLARCDFSRGWEFHELREGRVNSPLRRTGIAEWQGEPLEGKSLLVWCEEGFGDQIIMARFFSRLKAARITAYCLPELCSLFDEASITTIPRRANEVVAVSKHDYWVGSLSLPKWIGEPYWTGPYLSASAKRQGGFGVVWRGASTPDPTRSLPLAQARRLLALPGAVDLDVTATGATDFRDTAEIVAGLDFVISVDTSSAHLAAAMGKPVLLLLKHGSRDWRWSGVWYPNISIFRQEAPGDWNSAVSNVLSSHSEFTRVA